MVFKTRKVLNCGVFFFFQREVHAPRCALERHVSALHDDLPDVKPYSMRQTRRHTEAEQESSRGCVPKQNFVITPVLKIDFLSEGPPTESTPSQDCGWFALFTSQGGVKISSVCSET